jgi:hypothetical protein
MKQSRIMSAIESCANVFVGYWLAVAAQVAVFPAFAIHVAWRDQLAIGGIFTAVSLARSYALRRAFEAIRVRNGF